MTARLRKQPRGFLLGSVLVWGTFREWVHRLANLLDKLPKRLQPRAKSQLHEIFNSETKEIAEEQVGAFVKEYEDKYPKAVGSLLRDREKLFTFYDFPAAHWQSIRSTNVVDRVRLIKPMLEGKKFLDGKSVENNTQEGRKSAA
jgi:transposase-like protein